MKSHCYTHSQVDHTVFFKHSCEGKITILIIYVDDTILTNDDSLEIERLKGLLARDFEIKDLRTLKYFVGMEFANQRMEFLFPRGSTYWIYLRRHAYWVVKLPRFLLT